MGSLYSKLCSKISTHEGGHTVLNNNTLGGEADGSDPRTAAANAALRRAEAAQQRGVQRGGGKLAEQLAREQRQTRPGPESREEPRPVWD